MRHWIQSTFRVEDYYTADIFLGSIPLYTYSPIKLQPGLFQDKKVIVPVPDVIDDRITVHVYKSTSEKVGKSDVEYAVILYDKEGNKIKKSKVNVRGEAYFSNIRTGEYVLSLIEKFSDGKEIEWGQSSVLILGKQNTFEIIKSNLVIIQKIDESTEPTEKSSTVLSCMCVAFRLDDIQSFWLNNVQIGIINTFYESNLPLTIGIIGNLFGEDQKILEFVKKGITDENFPLEIANHGWEHEDFTSHTKEEQIGFVKKTNDIIFSLLGVKPSVFIPPFNNFNDDTIMAMHETGMTHFSSSIFKGDEPPFPLQNSTLYRFPEVATTGKFDLDLSRFVALPHEKTFTDLQTYLKDYGFAVVVIHPPEFAIIANGAYANEVNQEQLDELILLIDKVKESGLKLVPIGKINLDSSQIELNIPDWVKNNAGWWASGQIGDSDFVLGIQFLIAEEIMVIPNAFSGLQTSEEIPDWVKNNAGWWAEGKISDMDFVNGIQFLIKNGIIKV